MVIVEGYDQSRYKKLTCYYCYAILKYSPIDEEYTGETDEGTSIKGIECPSCFNFIRTNP